MVGLSSTTRMRVGMPCRGEDSANAARVLLIHAAELALEDLEVGANLGIARPEGLDLPHRADDRRVIPVAERATELGEAALEPLLAQVHGDVSREGDALVTILRQEIHRAQLEVVADDALDVLDARFVGPRGAGRGDFG